jgi:hypothetical protein
VLGSKLLLVDNGTWPVPSFSAASW